MNLTAENLRLVKVRGNGSFEYSIRYLDSKEIEHELCRYPSAKEATDRITTLKNLEPRTRACILAMDAIWPWALRIQSASEDQGTREYATKAHMRQWAGEIIIVLQDLYSIIDEDVVRP